MAYLVMYVSHWRDDGSVGGRGWRLHCYEGRGFAMLHLHKLLRIERAIIRFFLLDGKFVNSNSDGYWSEMDVMHMAPSSRH